VGRLDKEIGTGSEDAEGADRAGVVTGKGDEDDEVNGHKQYQENFPIVKFGQFVLAFEIVERFAVVNHDVVQPEEHEYRSLKAYLGSVGLVIHDD
jgi:hypothetical protein